MNLIHVGLGKTGSTSLQNTLSSEFCEKRGKVFNDPKIINLLRKSARFGFQPDQIRSLHERLQNNKNIISLERLTNWNPREWETQADNNLEIFGRNTHILITARETNEYLRSIYQQLIQKNLIIEPQKFFLNASEYELVKNIVNKYQLNIFDVDSYNLKKLHDIYKERFSKVTLIHMRDTVVFFSNYFNYDKNEINFFKNLYENSKHANSSYSDFAMRLTFIRAKILKLFGVRVPNLYDKQNDEILNYIKKKNDKKELQIKFIRSIKNHLAWRNLMQNGVSRFITKKYKLPSDCYLNESLAELNDKYLEGFRL